MKTAKTILATGLLTILATGLLTIIAACGTGCEIQKDGPIVQATVSTSLTPGPCSFKTECEKQVILSTTSPCDVKQITADNHELGITSGAEPMTGNCVVRAMCLPRNITVKAGYVPVQDIAGEGKQTRTFTSEIGGTLTGSLTDSLTTAITDSVSAGINAKGVNGDVKVTKSFADDQSVKIGVAMSVDEKTTFEASFPHAGTVWQWQMVIKSDQGSLSFMSESLALTPGAFAPPCCLPGYFENASDATGACHPTREGWNITLC